MTENSQSHAHRQREALRHPPTRPVASASVLGLHHQLLRIQLVHDHLPQTRCHSQLRPSAAYTAQNLQLHAPGQCEMPHQCHHYLTTPDAGPNQRLVCGPHEHRSLGHLQLLLSAARMTEDSLSDDYHQRETLRHSQTRLVASASVLCLHRLAPQLVHDCLPQDRRGHSQLRPSAARTSQNLQPHDPERRVTLVPAAHSPTVPAAHSPTLHARAPGPLHPHY